MINTFPKLLVEFGRKNPTFLLSSSRSKHLLSIKKHLPLLTLSSCNSKQFVTTTNSHHPNIFGRPSLNQHNQRSKRMSQQKRAAGSGDKTASGPARSGLNPWPEYIAEREKVWSRCKAAYEEFVAKQPRESIRITLPDGTVKEGVSWETSPMQIAKSISQGLAESAVIAKVNGTLWDLDRPLEGDCNLEVLKFDSDDGRYVFWHSSAHILGEAMERTFGGCLCYGPPVDDGFYYDMHIAEDTVSQEDFPPLDNLCKKIVKEKQPFERLEMSKADLLEMFKYNEFKQRIINTKIDTPTTTVYKCGPLIDLCRGPHVPHTGRIKAMMVTRNSSAYWEGKLSPGSCFFYPRGAHIYNTLVAFIREEYWKRGFSEVITPNIYNAKLWETSGHWQHYSDNMFKIEIEKETYGLKPMNCPGHCVMFGSELRSYKELPIRYADFGVLHRNELSGALSGLTRVRRFQQDDAHIFCREDQIRDEIGGCLDFLRHVYGIFGFTFKLELSTRPEQYLGEVELWDRAEKQLSESLNASGLEWKLNPGDGAFYGPKIDIGIQDALKRWHQCATIQLDFQLPQRFDLHYQSESDDTDASRPRPVIIHRAVLGSVERMMAILTENYAGKWPFWLSPLQAFVIPVVSACDDYATGVRDRLKEAGFMADMDLDPGKSLNKKIRNAQLAHYNFILVLGAEEQKNGTVNVRTRDNRVHGEHSLDHVIKRFTEFARTRTRDAEESF
uniref:threonine--tRNA ligase n=1 Tax=Macrostomum lignano TaxID=282301 RepID=A0A1I8FU34_9PLAT